MARTDDRFRVAFNALLDQCARLSPGERLPAELQLGQHLDVSRTVVRAALDRLRANGIIRWDGRDKTLLRGPQESDRLAMPSDPLSADELERQFLDWVLRFDVPPGTVLNVTELTRKFGVQAYALQEFLASLSRFGLVRRRSKGGWELVGFTRDYAVELSDFRMVLELNAISHLVLLPDDHVIWPKMAEIEAEHRALAEELDTRFHDFSPLDERFHSAVGSVVKNRFMNEFQKVITLVFHYHYQWDKTLERQRNEAAIAEHLLVMEALKRRDEVAALAAMREHLKTSKQTLLSSLKSNALA